MKKIILIIAAVLILGGCQFLDNLRSSILQKTNKTVENIGYQYETTKINVGNKLQQTGQAVEQVQKAADQVQKASNEVQKAADALKNISK